MATRAPQPESFVCETCGKKTSTLRRDVIDTTYNAIGKTPLWNCEQCYQQKRQERLTQAHDSSAPSF
jgi:protein-arginine kinase activator protein McsA